MGFPTRNGLAISPYELGFTVPTPEQLETRRAVTIHHGQWERDRYTGPRHRTVFRNLITNTYPMLAPEHIILHEDYDAPVRPKDSVMIDVLDEYIALHGFIECIREKQTRSTYIIMPEAYEGIKRGYKSGKS
jgi:hypothetical protein